MKLNLESIIPCDNYSDVQRLFPREVTADAEDAEPTAAAEMGVIRMIQDDDIEVLRLHRV